MRLWRKKHKGKHHHFERISVPVLIRQTIYDSMLTPPEGIAELMGLPPISDEVSEMEERASEDRLFSISGLLPFIDSHCDIASRIATAAYSLEGDSIIEDDQTLEKMTEMFRSVAVSSTVSCISTLANLGLIDSKVMEKHEH